MNLIKSSTPKRTWNDGFMPGIFSHLMDDFFTENRVANFQGFSPKTDISEDDKGFYLEVTLPGLHKEDVKVEMKHDILTIEGERKFENDEKVKSYHRIESGYGSFKRSFSLPDHINRDGVEAGFENGVLKLFLPKTEKVTPKTIQIK